MIEGQPPILTRPPTACPFRARCDHAIDRCDRENPRAARWTAAVGHGHDVACHWTPRPPQEVAHA